MQKKKFSLIYPYQITDSCLEKCQELLATWINGECAARYAACANPHSLEIARNDRLFHEALFNADLLIPDGVGVVIGSKVLGGTIRRRITGFDIFTCVNQLMNGRGGKSCFFLGAATETLERIKTQMQMDYPRIQIAGCYSPPFKQEFTQEDNIKIIQAINKVKPDVLWVGMTAPKQEKWIYENRHSLEVKFIGAIGAVFDFYAGRIKRSPKVFQKLGLEWLPRFIQEPRRLWRRNLISNPSFLLRIFMEKLGIM